MPSVLPISVVIVASNEAHNLPRCLASVRGWTAETVVVVNNCTDPTPTLAREGGAIVVKTIWRGYRDIKNFPLDQAHQPWALCLDTDEEVSPALRDEIRCFFAEGRANYFDGGRFPRKVWFIDRWILYGDWYPDLSLRLIRRRRARWCGSPFVHEKMEVDGAVATLAEDLHHYSFSTLNNHIAKFIPFADLFLQQKIATGGMFFVSAAVFPGLCNQARLSGWIPGILYRQRGSFQYIRAL